MRLLLDSRDLIDLVERSRPLPIQEFDAYLRSGNHQLVLTFTNVRELAGPLSEGIEFMRVRPFLQSLERMPLTYLRETTVVPVELQSAVDAFQRGAEYSCCSPYVRRWDYTLSRREPATWNWINFRLDEIVYELNRGHSDVFQPMEPEVGNLRQILRADRELLRAGKLPARQAFLGSVRKHAAYYGVDLPQGREEKFAEWIYANPNRCSGLRLGYEVLRAITTNYGDIPEPGDFSDLAHVFAVPHVDAATLDRRMRHYCASASRKMLRFGASQNFTDRIYEDVAALMRECV
jgi:hypothetical protein